MATQTTDLERHLTRLTQDLESEFPDIPTKVIEEDLQSRIRELCGIARFNDFVPLLAHRAAREHLRSAV